MIKHSCPTLEKDDINAVIEVMKTKEIAQGNKVKEFENKLAKFTKQKYAFAFNSGSSALHIALLAMDIWAEDEVIIPDFVCHALLNVIEYVGAIPIIVDIDEEYNISPEQIERHITGKTTCIIVPHMFGKSAKIDQIMKIAKKHNLWVIEDCAQSIGGKGQGLGDISMYSFYATKMMTTGEGGALTTNDKELAKKIEVYKDYSKQDEYFTSYNYKMTDMQAALGISQLKKLPEFIKKRIEIAEKYNKLFGLKLDKNNIYYRYVIRVENADKYITDLKKKGINAEKPIYKLLHTYLEKKNRLDYPNSCEGYDSCISLPIYPSLKDKEIQKIIRVLK